MKTKRLKEDIGFLYEQWAKMIKENLDLTIELVQLTKEFEKFKLLFQSPIVTHSIK